MVREGDVLENPVTGQRLTFLKTARDTGGELLEVEAEYTKPSPSRPSVHFHPRQEERFEVLSGEVHAQIYNEERSYNEGEVFVIPPGTPHTMWAEQGGARVNWQTRPALRTEEFFEVAWNLAKAGKVNDEGVPHLLQAAVIAREYDAQYRLAKPPWPVQKALFAVLAPIGRSRGYRATWREKT